MKKTVLTAAIALALTTGFSAPASAGGSEYRNAVQTTSASHKPTEIDKFAANPVRYIIAMLLPAIQR